MHTLQSEIHLQPTYGTLKKKKRKKEQPVKLVSERFVVLQALSFSRFNLKQNDANINKTGRAAVLF